MTIRACTIGYPLGHSLSRVIHTHWFAQYGIDGAYESHPIEPGSFEHEAARLAASYNGFSVTLPYKEKIIPFCMTLDSVAASIGAVNMVAVGRDGAMRGHNTDAYGFAENLRRNAPDLALRDSPALVLGAGGASRAVLHALKTGGVPDLVIANRSRDRADALAAHFGCRAVDWHDAVAAMRETRLLVNTTSLGMQGQPPLDLSLDALPPSATVCDIVYKPLMTPLLCAARDRGLATVTGIGMLLHQAVPAFEAWTGIRPAVDAALETLVLGQAS